MYFTEHFYKMGCAGSKNEMHHTEHPIYKDPVAKETKKEPERDDEEVLIVQQGKTIKNSALDDLTEKNSSISKTQAKPIIPTNQTRPIETQNQFDIKENQSMSLYIERSKDEKTENRKEEKGNESTEAPSLKSKTVKVEFEKHPHEFDFSFIEDEEKAQNKEKEEEDLLTDQVLKEISEN